MACKKDDLGYSNANSDSSVHEISVFFSEILWVFNYLNCMAYCRQWQPSFPEFMQIFTHREQQYGRQN